MKRFFCAFFLLSVLTGLSLAQDADQPDTKQSKDAAAAKDNDAAEEPAAPPQKKKSSKHHRGAFHIDTGGSGSDRVVFGDNVEVKEGEEVHDVVVIGGSATVNGKVTGDCVVIGGTVELGPKAELERDLTVVGGVLDADPEAKINGNRVVIGIGAPFINIPG